MQLSTYQKYRICQVLFGAGFFGTLFWMSRMSPWVSAHHNKVVFAGMMATVVITIPFALGFYYYRARLRDLDTGSVQVEALANAGKRPVDTNHRQ